MAGRRTVDRRATTWGVLAVVRKVPLRYHPSYWALVFPLGMYGVASFKMRAAIGLHGLGWVPKLSLAVALAAWTTTFVGMLDQGRRSASASSRGSDHR